MDISTECVVLVKKEDVTNAATIISVERVVYSLVTNHNCQRSEIMKVSSVRIKF